MTREIPVSMVSSASVSPDGRALALGTSSGDVSLVDLASGAITRSWHALDGVVVALRFRPGDGFLAVLGTDRIARVWEPASGRLLAAAPPFPDVATARRVDSSRRADSTGTPAEMRDRSRRAATSQTRRLPSKPKVRAEAPSRLKITSRTRPWCPSRLPWLAPVEASQSATVPSSDDVARVRPSGESATDRTPCGFGTGAVASGARGASGCGSAAPTVKREAPVATSHARAVPSFEAV